LRASRSTCPNASSVVNALPKIEGKSVAVCVRNVFQLYWANEVASPRATTAKVGTCKRLRLAANLDGP
jgi:hypothetical protein